MARKRFIPGEGQFSMLGEPEVKSKKVVRRQKPTPKPSMFEAPSTSLRDHYGVLAGALKAIGQARSNQKGFTKLPDDHEVIKDFSARFNEAEPDETRKIVSKAGKKHRLAAFELFRRHNGVERAMLRRYAEATNEFSLEYVTEKMPLPLDVYTVEYKYFDDIEKTPKELEEARTAIYDAARYYESLEEAQRTSESA